MLNPSAIQFREKTGYGSITYKSLTVVILNKKAIKSLQTNRRRSKIF